MKPRAMNVIHVPVAVLCSLDQCYLPFSFTASEGPEPSAAILAAT